MLLLSGQEVSSHKRAEIAKRVARFKKKYKRAPGLAVVLIGDDPASAVYVRNKIKACSDVGIVSFHFELKAKTSQKAVISLIQKLNRDKKVDGILVQLPLPQKLDKETIIAAISPQKDADGLTHENLGLLFAGQTRVAGCTPSGVIEILKHYKIEIAGRNCVVVGRSLIVGKPMAQLLLDENATVTVVHSKTLNAREFTKKADIVVVAAGKPRFMGADDFKPGAIVVDVGIHRQNNKLCGDVRFDELQNVVAAATPVPGGVGPMTITMLLENTVRLAELRQKSS